MEDFLDLIQPSVFHFHFRVEVGRKKGGVMEEKTEISFLKVEAEVAAWDWEELWPKGIRSTFNRRPSLGVKSNASGSLKLDLFQ